MTASILEKSTVHQHLVALVCSLAVTAVLNSTLFAFVSKLRGISSRTNYTDQTTAACPRS
jgi:hypothetical protein